MDSVAAGEAPVGAVAVTFDDGYAATLRHVLPVLEAQRMPATVFLSTGHVATQSGFWWDELKRLIPLSGGARLRLTVDGETRAWADGGTALRHVIAWLQPKLPESIAAAVAQLRAHVGANPGPGPGERPVAVDEIRAAASSGLISFGAHTRTHPNLRFVSAERRRAELMGSRSDVAGWLGTVAPPAGLAYPFGLLGADVDATVRHAAVDAGYRYAVVNQPGVIRPGTDRFALPRTAPPDTCDAAFAALVGVSAR